MYIVIIEDHPARCMDQLQIEYFDTQEEAKDFADVLCEEEPPKWQANKDKYFQ